MRILVIADIHSNWMALSAIQESFDVCLCLGDIVDYGTDPAPCIDWMRRHATAIRGNHDHAVAQRVAVREGGGRLRQLAAATRPLHWDMLKNGQLKFLARLPLTRNLVLDGLNFHLVHATPLDPLDEHLPQDPNLWRRRLAEVEADFVLVGHTHMQFHLDLERCQLVNPGSVGQPRDGDPRCAYAIIENGQVELKRVAYDIDATLRQMQSLNVPADVVAYSELILRTGGRLDDAEDGD